MATMDALMVEAVGQPIVKGKRPIPTPSEGEILVKVTVVGLNPYDFRVRDWGLYVEGRLPVVLGNDIAGTVEKLDQLPEKPLGPMRPARILPARRLQLRQKIPENLTDDDGASLVCNMVAPFWAIFGAHGLGLPFPFPSEEDAAQAAFDYSSQTILILGAGSNCGKYGVQASALAGFGTIIAVADARRNGSDLRSYGATHIIDRHAADDDVAAQIRSLVGDELVYAFDAVNVDHTLGVRCLSNTKRGTLACIVPGKVDEASLAGAKKAGFDDKFIQGQSSNQPQLGRKFWDWLPVWMREGRVRSTGWTVLEGLDPVKVNAVLDAYRDNRWPEKQVHVHL
ncbi:hypothetical protein EPUS_07117 [Endocarpon pusillum Z07020]|uniref:Uncharacterized protein n=1 Tax=Endocarpon pusillum (strain Z07020 / HMAS-L-300199) TaxID=1263415 RepID=U1GLC0_ENDPU|nr:uncharacterized protein EPUS_07117 [Endocarpon pusillum Z07020]ERF73023.1 hypothetical protein EPUS_07117 [Endocarpon pusillum Z07020]